MQLTVMLTVGLTSYSAQSRWSS